MGQKKQLSILEFSRLTGIARDNLRFYDRIGLLKPALRGDNGYRYYTRHQLGSAYLISSLRLLGVGLEEIRRYSADRTPDKMLALFAVQEARIQAEIARLREASEIMERYANMAREALCHRESQLMVEERKRERIFLCPPTPAVADTDEAEILAYEYAIGHGINPGYPLGALIPREGFPPPPKNRLTATILWPGKVETPGSRPAFTPWLTRRAKGTTRRTSASSCWTLCGSGG